MPHDSVVGSVDGRTVGKAIAASVRPLLRRAGFTEFTQRKAWRPTEHTVAAVNFRSFNSYLADGIGSTTHSFCVDVGLLYRAAYRERGPHVIRPGGRARPEVWETTFRWQLHKGIQQPLFHPYGRAEASDRPDVWFVPADGEGLEVIVEDATRAFAADGLPVLDFLADPENAFTALVTNIPLEGLPFRRPHDWSRPGPPSEVWFSTARAIGSLRGGDFEWEIEQTRLLDLGLRARADDYLWYVAVIWVGDEPPRHSNVYASSPEAARQKIEAEFGEGHPFRLVDPNTSTQWAWNGAWTEQQPP